MARAGDLDWSDLMKGDVGEPEHSLSRPLNTDPNKHGNMVTREELLKEADIILNGFNQPHLRSPTKREFDDIVRSMIPTQSSMTDEEWNNMPNKVFNDLKKSKVQEKPDAVDKFANGRSFNNSLSREELLDRNMYCSE